MISKIIINWLKILFIFQFILDLRLCASSSNQKIHIQLNFGSNLEVSIPNLQDKHSHLELTYFINSRTKVQSQLCSLQTTSPPFFRTYGRLEHNSALPYYHDFWEGGKIWDSIQVENRIICVFQNGQVSEYRYQLSNSSLKKIVKTKLISPLKSQKIRFGKLLSLQLQNSQNQILYVSQNKCFLINEDGTWSNFEGYDLYHLNDALVINGKLYVANHNQLSIFTVNLQNMTIGLEKQQAIYVERENKKYSIEIQKMKYNPKSQRLFLIDEYDGVAYFNIKEQNKIQLKHLIEELQCQDIQIYGQLLFIACSHLYIINATTLVTLQKINSSFQITSIFYNLGQITVFGDDQFAIYSIFADDNEQIVVNYRFKGFLPERKHYKYLYSTFSEYFVLFDKLGIQYGKIENGQYVLSCFHQIYGGLQDQIKGQNIGYLKIERKCQAQRNSDLLDNKDCQEIFEVSVEVQKIKWIKIIIWFIAVCFPSVSLIFVGRAIKRFIKLKGKKTQYTQLTQIRSTTENIQNSQMNT